MCSLEVLASRSGGSTADCTLTLEMSKALDEERSPDSRPHGGRRRAAQTTHTRHCNTSRDRTLAGRRTINTLRGQRCSRASACGTHQARAELGSRRLKQKAQHHNHVRENNIIPVPLVTTSGQKENRQLSQRRWTLLKIGDKT